jgi:hypothetical protein
MENLKQVEVESVNEVDIPSFQEELNYEELSNFYCSSEWHLARLRCPTAALVYPFALRISKNSGKFSCSAISVARFLDVHRTTVLRAYHQLSELGFFELLEYGRFDTNIYSVVLHSDWAERHPGRCIQKIQFPWSGEGDPLAQQLYAASGGRVKFREFQIREYRKMGLDEAELVARFNEFRAGVGKYRQPRNVGFHFLKYLRGSCKHNAQTLIT